VTSGIGEGHRILPAKTGLPQERQVQTYTGQWDRSWQSQGLPVIPLRVWRKVRHPLTLKVGKPQVLPTEVLHDLHPIHYNGPPEDVCQSKDVYLLEGLSLLVCKGHHSCPVLPQLFLVQAEPLSMGLTLLRLLPAFVEPGRKERRKGY